MHRSPASNKLELPAYVDVLVIGAGVAGIGVACHLRTKTPDKTFAIIEARDAIGGTWDTFRYPGIRSDSDLFTFGYEFKPWTRDNAIADGHEILAYLKETIAEYDLADRIHVGWRVARADWSSELARWGVTLVNSTCGEEVEVFCRILFCASGYYDHASGYTPEFRGREGFAGQLIHPQEWPERLDYAGKKVVIIGSGATAVTLVPAMAGTAEHVTMLQRSPTYVVPCPRKNPVANKLRRLLPTQLAYRITRAAYIAGQVKNYQLAKAHPETARRLIRTLNARSLPESFDVDVHFNPTYDPWDQRVCLVPDGDLFKAITAGNASVVTDKIERFVPEGIRLTSGRILDADIIVTATGLNLLPFGGLALSVDGRDVPLNETLAFKGMMLAGVPNFVYAIGYTNASWTLKVDLVAEHFCRLLRYMDRDGYVSVAPIDNDPSITPRPYLEFGAGYVQRGVDRFPKQGSHGPWTLIMNYYEDRDRLRDGPVVDPALNFNSLPVVGSSLRRTAG